LIAPKCSTCENIFDHFFTLSIEKRTEILDGLGQILSQSKSIEPQFIKAGQRLIQQIGQALNSSEVELINGLQQYVESKSGWLTTRLGKFVESSLLTGVIDVSIQVTDLLSNAEKEIVVECAINSNNSLERSVNLTYKDR